MVPTDRERQTAIDQLVALLTADDRIVAVVLVGSAAGGKTDQWSDVDLEVAVDGSADTSAVAADWVTRMYAEFELAHHFEVSFGATLVRGFLLTGLLEVDLSFESVDELSVWEPARLLFDRAGAGVAALRRPATWEAQPPDLAGGVLPATRSESGAQPRVAAPRGLRGLLRLRRRSPTDERAPLEGSLVGSLAEEELIAAIESATGGYLAELRRGDPALAARLGPPLLEMVAAVRDRRPRDAR